MEVTPAAAGSPEEERRRYFRDYRRRQRERKRMGLVNALGISVIVESLGGITSNGAWLAKMIRSVGHPRCGTLPDLGNFTLDDGKEYDRYKGVTEMMPLAKAVSAKSYDFDDKGNETKIDFGRMMKIVVAAGYHGYVGIEYEGEKMGEMEGILATKRLLERVRGQMMA